MVLHLKFCLWSYSVQDSYLNLLILNHFCWCIYCFTKQVFFSSACNSSGEQLLAPFTIFCPWYQKLSNKTEQRCSLCCNTSFIELSVCHLQWIAAEQQYFSKFSKIEVSSLPLEQAVTRVGCCPNPRTITRATTHVVWYCPLSSVQLKKEKLFHTHCYLPAEVQHHTEKVLLQSPPESSLYWFLFLYLPFFWNK